MFMEECIQKMGQTGSRTGKMNETFEARPFYIYTYGFQARVYKTLRHATYYPIPSLEPPKSSLRHIWSLQL